MSSKTRPSHGSDVPTVPFPLTVHNKARYSREHLASNPFFYSWRQPANSSFADDVGWIQMIREGFLLPSTMEGNE